MCMRCICIGGSRSSFSGLGQNINVAIAGVALTGGGEFGPTVMLFRLGDFGD